MKEPKGKGPEQIQRRLQKSSPWFTSIRDPLHGADCKIPDETGVETGTVQLVMRHVTHVRDEPTSTGMAGCRVYSPYVNVMENGASSGPDGLNVQYLATDTDNINITWNAGVPKVSPYVGVPFTGAADLTEIADSHRIVSAAMYIQPEPSNMTNQGDICLFATPFNVPGDYGGTYDDYSNLYKSVNYPVNSAKPSVIRWYPFARNDWNFKSFIRTDADQLVQDDNSESDSKLAPLWSFGFIASGMEPGTAIRVTTVVNYEFIPKFNSLNILNASPSPQDATETDLVENWVQQMDVGTLLPAKQVASSPSSVSPSHEDDQSGFGMFFNVVKEILPLAMLLI